MTWLRISISPKWLFQEGLLSCDLKYQGSTFWNTQKNHHSSFRVVGYRRDNSFTEIGWPILRNQIKVRFCKMPLELYLGAIAGVSKCWLLSAFLGYMHKCTLHSPWQQRIILYNNKYEKVEQNYHCLEVLLSLAPRWIMRVNFIC